MYKNDKKLNIKKTFRVYKGKIKVLGKELLFLLYSKIKKQVLVEGLNEEREEKSTWHRSTFY